MSITTHSSRLSTGTSSPPGTTTIVQVPVNETWIVKDLWIHNFGAVSTNVKFWLNRGVTPYKAFLCNQSIGAGQDFHLSTWTVASEADRVGCSTDAAGIYWWMSGSLLSGIAQP